jgi:hypothetical protein
MTPENDPMIDALAARHQVSRAVVRILRDAVARGRGRMAQFSHPEIGGQGQWIAGGMTMIGDMFNQSLRAKVATLCEEIAAALTQQPATATANVWFTTGPSSAWWPASLGAPAQTGGQNATRYAIFPSQHRLAVDEAGAITVYDTQDYVIGGIAQQQGVTASFTLSTDRGPVALSSLPVVSIRQAGAEPAGSAGETPSQVKSVAGAPPAPARSAADMPPTQTAAVKPDVTPRPNISKQDLANILRVLDQLAELNGKGILTDAEFDAKKAEVLARL